MTGCCDLVVTVQVLCSMFYYAHQFIYLLASMEYGLFLLGLLGLGSAAMFTSGMQYNKTSLKTQQVIVMSLKTYFEKWKIRIMSLGSFLHGEYL